jgi:hypothetical protein
MTTLPQDTTKEKKDPGRTEQTSIRVESDVVLEMNEEALRRKRLTGEKPALMDLVREAWGLYKANTK